MERSMSSYLFSIVPPVLLSIPVNTPLCFFEKYIFSDWVFLIYLSVIVIIDTALAWVYHIKNKSFSSKGFAKFFKKVIYYFLLLVVANAAKGIETKVMIDHGGLWVASLICWSLFMREGLSIMENLSKLDINIVPPVVMKYFKDYNEIKKKENS